MECPSEDDADFYLKRLKKEITELRPAGVR
ncbi:hypothetical protein N182_01390 [Sinorhizobium sp. GL2]|nr:hypothetical protein N182_01390 [Sinorhizobium sp. GL2]